MFESIRKHSKIVMILLFLLIIPSFVLVGIDSNYFSEKSAVVARVDGNKITQTEWDNAHRNFVEVMQSVKETIAEQLRQAQDMPMSDLLTRRFDRIMAYGTYAEK